MRLFSPLLLPSLSAACCASPAGGIAALPTREQPSERLRWRRAGAREATGAAGTWGECCYRRSSSEQMTEKPRSQRWSSSWTCFPFSPADKTLLKYQQGELRLGASEGSGSKSVLLTPYCIPALGRAERKSVLPTRCCISAPRRQLGCKSALPTPAARRPLWGSRAQISAPHFLLYPGTQGKQRANQCSPLLLHPVSSGGAEGKSVLPTLAVSQHPGGGSLGVNQCSPLLLHPGPSRGARCKSVFLTPCSVPARG